MFSTALFIYTCIITVSEPSRTRMIIKWASWERWSSCSVTCNTGSRKRI